MFYGGLAVGIVVGAGGYFLYDKYFSTVYNLGKSLLNKAEGDVVKAIQHITKLV